MRSQSPSIVIMLSTAAQRSLWADLPACIHIPRQNVSSPAEFFPTTTVIQSPSLGMPTAGKACSSATPQEALSFNKDWKKTFFKMQEYLNNLWRRADEFRELSKSDDIYSPPPFN